MLVRDPADRALSWFNDKLSSGGGKGPSTFNSWALGNIRNRNYQYSAILEQALDCGVDPRAILVVDTDGLKASPEDAQSVMDFIDSHYGLPRMKHSLEIHNEASPSSGRHTNVRADADTIETIYRKMEGQTLGFRGLLENPGSILLRSLNFTVRGE